MKLQLKRANNHSNNDQELAYYSESFAESAYTSTNSDEDSIAESYLHEQVEHPLHTLG